MSKQAAVFESVKAKYRVPNAPHVATVARDMKQISRIMERVERLSPRARKWLLKRLLEQTHE